jgi:acylphosphatase
VTRDVVAFRVVASGRVQGVNFRWSTREASDRHAVVGWVKNRPDGTVEAILQGDRGGVDQVLEWMRAGGPPAGRVDSLDVTPIAVDDHLDRFTLER